MKTRETGDSGKTRETGKIADTVENMETGETTWETGEAGLATVIAVSRLYNSPGVANATPEIQNWCGGCQTY